MMGRTHVLSGLAAGALTLPLLQDGIAGGEQASWIVAVAGMAILPDLDHPQATVAGMWGPLTEVIARAVATTARGHRAATHDPIVAPLVFAALFWLADLTIVGQLVTIAFGLGLGLRAIAISCPGRGLDHPLINITVSAAGSWWIVTEHAPPGWIPHAAALGVLVHIAGDALTEGGIPAPLSWLTGAPRRLPGGPLSTGGRVERLVIAPALLVATAWCLAARSPLHLTDALTGMPIG